jgi:DNA (cytosine-5)-methyltransferase 1
MDFKKNNSNELTFIDLFAGIGGFHLGMNRNGFKCVFASEKDAFARKTYTLNFKNPGGDSLEFPLNEDITQINPEDIPDFDILCAGFPCQPFSQAGKKLGFNDTRGTLFFNIAEIIKTKQPEAFFLENVRNLYTHDGGRTFEVIKQTLEDLGYSFYHKIIKASEFNCPQHRARLYMVGFKNKNIKFQFPKPVKLTTTMSDIFQAPCSRSIGFTLRVGGRGSPITDRRNWDAYLVDGKVIRLNPKTGKKMQGFPESYTFPVSHSQAMKQLGNSVAIPVIEAISREIKNCLLENNKTV